MKSGRLFFLIVIFSLSFSGNVFSDTKNTQSEKEVVKQESDQTEIKVNEVKPANDSQKVFIDPETGEFLNEQEALERGIIEDFSQSLKVGPEDVEEELVEKPLSGGGFMVELPETYDHSIEAEIDEKGDTHTSCDHK
ncbi:MAG: hypothetical protein ACRENO_09070 [Thermodesulfobacteriota bacterium]